jgi:magnesium-protoporphyrin O-methyltransferase
MPNSIDCCQCQGIETRFDEAYVTEKLKEYHTSGPKKTTRKLIDALEAQGVQGLTMLDIGGGVGDIIHALLQAGVDQGTNVEASSAYAQACEREAARLGHAERVRVFAGDFIDIAANLPLADIVTLDRVVCCYHDFRELVSRSVEKARRYYGLVYPRDKLWVKVVMNAYYNLRFWLQRNPFRVFVHPEKEVDSLIMEYGFEHIFFEESGPWQIVVYAKVQ